jgi:hypothetical protein
MELFSPTEHTQQYGNQYLIINFAKLEICVVTEEIRCADSTQYLSVQYFTLYTWGKRLKKNYKKICILPTLPVIPSMEHEVSNRKQIQFYMQWPFSTPLLSMTEALVQLVNALHIEPVLINPHLPSSL